MKKKRPTKTDYERYLNDHPIKDHPSFERWSRLSHVRSPRWGAWLRESDRPAFDELYKKNILTEKQ